MRQEGWPLRVKRIIDVVGATTGLVVFSPVLLGVAVAVHADLGAPVLFRQQRAGLGGKPFLLVKFRTMRSDTMPDGSPLPDDRRLSRLGAWLRATSLDELPELWNVLKGDMSLVGPRPLLMQYNGRYSPAQARRLDVPPGLTGWAQINGRNALSWEERFALDTWYVDHWTPLLDLRILFSTIGTVVRRDGIAHDGHATMFEFLGNATTATH